MKDRASFALLLGAACALAIAQAASAQVSVGHSGWNWGNPLPQGNAINAIAFTKDKRHGWAIGADGAILLGAMLPLGPGNRGCLPGRRPGFFLGRWNAPRTGMSRSS